MNMSEESLFHEALARPPAEWGAYLDQACAGDPALRAAVEVLLAAHGAPGSFLDRPAVAQPEGQGASVPATLGPVIGPGAVIAGRYTLLESIGEGGMGRVWVAEQTQPVRRKVALKLIRAGMDSRAVLARFEQERQALALMDHPNIARVLDGGMTGGEPGGASPGRPFFGMELVNGLPLTRFCDQGKLTPQERLELFVPVCQAVQHAHQKGIIHRDLKPSNILVTLYDDKPVPKVIDFGVAKAIGDKLTSETLSTQLGAVVGTLEYMAPEQAGFGALDIDTRADIYSLGVILYELLTGLRPIDEKRLRQADGTAQATTLRQLGGEFEAKENPTIKELLDRAAAELTPAKIEAKFPGQKAVQASILQTVGETYRGIGDYGKAEAFLVRASALARQAWGADHPDTLAILSNLALVYKQGGKLAQAIELYEQLRHASVKKLGASDLATLVTLNNLATAYQTAGQLPQATRLLQQVHGALARKLGPDDPRTLAS
jgi:serine/threonine protein kinase